MKTKGTAAAKSRHKQQAHGTGSCCAGGDVRCRNCWRSLVWSEVMLSCLARRRLCECKLLLLWAISGTPSYTQPLYFVTLWGFLLLGRTSCAARILFWMKPIALLCALIWHHLIRLAGCCSASPHQYSPLQA